MKLPNGYGSVYKLKGQRRKPWVARKTVGWKDNRQPKYVFVGYYQTRGEALHALSEYNGYQLTTSPSETSLALVYSLCEDDMTVHYTGAWKHLSELADTPIGDLTLQRIQVVFDRSTAPLQTKKYMKALLRKLFDHAIRHEMIRPEKASIVKWIDIKGEKSRTVERSVFTPKEIASLWSQFETDRNASIPLIMIYFGLRVDELLSMKPEDVDEDIHIRRSKTEAGIRDLPIPPRLRPLFDVWSDDGYSVIKTPRGNPMTYDSLVRRYWNTDHRPHDCRHTCASLLADAGIDPRTVRAILGHKGKDIAEDIYTHISRESKLKAIETICR